MNEEEIVQTLSHADRQLLAEYKKRLEAQQSHTTPRTILAFPPPPRSPPRQLASEPLVQPKSRLIPRSRESEEAEEGGGWTYDSDKAGTSGKGSPQPKLNAVILNPTDREPRGPEAPAEDEKLSLDL